MVIEAPGAEYFAAFSINLGKGTFDHRWIDIDQRQVVGDGQRDLTVAKQPPLANQRAVDDVLGIDPSPMRPDSVAADARRVKQVLDVAVEPLGFVAHHADQGRQVRIPLDRRRLGKN